MKRRRYRQAFWFLLMDALVACGRFGGATFLYCVARASDCEDWEAER